MDEKLTPTPLEITSNIINQQSTPLSLRIKESTRILFEQEAKKRGVKLSSFINNLLDEYAKHYITEQNLQASINLKTLLRYIGTVAVKTPLLDFETLLRDLIEEYHGCVRTVDHLATDPGDGELFIRDVMRIATGRPVRFLSPKDEPFIYTNDGAIYLLPPGATAHVDTELCYDEYSPHELKEFGIEKHLTKGYCVNLCLPPEHWIIVCTLVAATEQRAKQLTGFKPYLGEMAYRIIAQFSITAPGPSRFTMRVAELIQNMIKRQYENPEDQAA